METSHANQVELRNLQMEDYDQLARSFKRIYADSDVFWTHAQIKKLITIFPEGQVAFDSKWYNLNLQDYLPTWRFWITDRSDKVTAAKRRRG
jgi:endo-beta-N-acetylglucosaminidase D